MNLNEENLKNLQILLAAMSKDHLGRAEFDKIVEQILDLFLKIEKRTSEAVTTLENTYANVFDKLHNKHLTSLEDLKGQVDQVFVGDKVSKMQKEHGARMKAVDERMAKVRDGKDGAPGPRGEQGIGLPGKPGKDADLAIIENLKNEIEALKKRPTGKMTGMRKVPIIKRYNLTSQVNGTLKAFIVPQDTVDVLGVFGTQFPINFNPGTDWTFTGNTITLGAQVGAPAVGQTLYAIIETLFYG